jgi:hypothetical protein
MTRELVVTIVALAVAPLAALADSPLPPDRFPYFVLQMGSDGETYARFSVHGSVAWCERRSSRMDEQVCWSQLAAATGDRSYCERIAAIGMRADERYRRLR